MESIDSELSFDTNNFVAGVVLSVEILSGNL